MSKAIPHIQHYMTIMPQVIDPSHSVTAAQRLWRATASATSRS